MYFFFNYFLKSYWEIIFSDFLSSVRYPIFTGLWKREMPAISGFFRGEFHLFCKVYNLPKSGLSPTLSFLKNLTVFISKQNFLERGIKNPQTGEEKWIRKKSFLWVKSGEAAQELQRVKTKSSHQGSFLSCCLPLQNLQKTAGTTWNSPRGRGRKRWGSAEIEVLLEFIFQRLWERFPFHLLSKQDSSKIFPLSDSQICRRWWGPVGAGWCLK